MTHSLLYKPTLIIALLGSGLLLGEATLALQEQVQKVASQASRFKKVVVFDIGGVIAAHSEKSLYCSIGFRAFRKTGLRMLFGINQLKRAHMKPLLFKVLEASAEYPDSLERMYDDHGTPCPKGMCALNSGLITLKELRTAAGQVIDTWLEEDTQNQACFGKRIHFMSTMQAEFIRCTINTIFDECSLANSYSILPGKQTLEYVLGQPDVQVMILSNFPLEQFFHLQHHLPELLYGVPGENIFVSGMPLAVDTFGTDTQGNSYRLAVKPNQAAFEAIKHVCKLRWHVDPENIIMIDNQRENIRAAEQAGLCTYLVNADTKGSEYNCTFEELHQELVKQLETPTQTA